MDIKNKKWIFFKFLVKITTEQKERMIYVETLQKICLIITIIGAINWGLIGLFDFNLVATLFGTDSIIPRIVYTLVGITGLINLGLLFEHID